MLKTKSMKNQKGIGIGAIIGIVALLAVLGAVIASSLGGGSNNTASEQDKLNASSILMQSGSLKDGADLLIAKYREAAYDDISLTTNWVTTSGSEDFGLYNAGNGTLEYLVPPKAAFTSASTAEWVVVDAATSTINFGGSASTDSYFKVETLTDPVCQAINVALGLEDSVTPTTTGRTAYCESGVYYKTLQVL